MKNTPHHGYQILFRLLLCAVVLGCSSSGGTDFLDDRANLLKPEEAAHIEAFHKALLTDFDVHFRLVVLAQKSDGIYLTASQRFGDLGQKTQGAKGLLFLVDPYGKQVKIEVGYDLEPYFPDIFIGYLEEKQMLPFLLSNRIGHGIEATTELLIGRLQRGIAGQHYDPAAELTPLAHYSGGGGARIGIQPAPAGTPNTGAISIENFPPQETPEAAIALYKRVLEARIKEPNLPLYTEQTRNFLHQWVMTDGQQENELRMLNSVTPEKVIVDGTLAVIRFSLHEQLHPPYLFARSGEGWQLDLWTMSQVIQMNHQNMWHFRNLIHPYMFAFSDWEFDPHGFPSRLK